MGVKIVPMSALNYHIEIEREDGGDWIAEIVDLPGAIAHAPTKEEAVAKVEALALRVIADEIETTKAAAGSVSFACA